MKSKFYKFLLPTGKFEYVNLTKANMLVEREYGEHYSYSIEYSDGTSTSIIGAIDHREELLLANMKNNSDGFLFPVWNIRMVSIDKIAEAPVFGTTLRCTILLESGKMFHGMLVNEELLNLLFNTGDRDAFTIQS